MITYKGKESEIHTHTHILCIYKLNHFAAHLKYNIVNRLYFKFFFFTVISLSYFLTLYSLRKGHSKCTK